MNSYDDEFEPDISEFGAAALVNNTYKQPPSPLTCPECGGALWEVGGNEMLRYRCHVGHGFTPDSSVAEQSRNLEAALWTALRALEENAALNRRLAQRMSEANLTSLLERYQERADLAEQRANLIREVLLVGNAPETEIADEGQQASDTIANTQSRNKDQRLTQ